MISSSSTSSSDADVDRFGEQTESIVDLVAGALEGDQRCWGVIVERHQAIITAVGRRFRLSGEDADDLSQTVWLRVTENIRRLRDPRALPGWIKTTAEREALALIKTARRTIAYDPGTGQHETAPSWASVSVIGEPAEVDSRILGEERVQVVRRGLADLVEPQRNLLLMLVSDAQVSYQQISDRLGMPLGSIGPTRARSLRRLRSTDAVRSFFADDERELAATA